jgi:hypothetical protein
VERDQLIFVALRAVCCAWLLPVCFHNLLCVLWFACCMRCRTCAAGIGFKATAVASEATYIASSGYEFCFDLRPGAYSVPWLGLVCPRWEGGLTQRMQGWAARRAQGGAQGLAP